jgi:hypothetical protein
METGRALKDTHSASLHDGLRRMTLRSTADLVRVMGDASRAPGDRQGVGGESPLR